MENSDPHNESSSDLVNTSAEEQDVNPPSRWSDWIRQGLRASTLRRVHRLPAGPGAATMLFLIATITLIALGAERLEVNGPVSFDGRSWLFGWAPAALLIFGVWLVLHSARAQTVEVRSVAAWYLLYSVATLPIILYASALSILASYDYFAEQWASGHWLAWGLYVFAWVWLSAVIWRVSQPFARSAPVLAALVVCVLLVNVVSSWQLDTRSWQSIDPEDDEYAFVELSQEVFESQQALLQAELQKITPAVNDQRQVFGLIYAPYAEDVFLRESAMVKEVLEKRFGAHGRVIRLVNNAATAAELPWATPLNLERSLRAIATAMDPARDVLVLYLTSHGGDDFKLAAEHWPLEVQDLTAARLRHMLDELNVQHRVIAVSACYSGGWIEPLRGDNTLIMTAADEEHTSYGCGSSSELTFFGRAVFDEQLRTTHSFEEAFTRAVPVIAQREIDAKKNDGFSNPQISVGSSIRNVLDDLARDTVEHRPSAE